MTTFIKWFLLTAATVTALFLAEQQGAITLILTNDKSFLGVTIMTLFVMATGFTGYLSYKADSSTSEQRSELNRKSSLGWFCAEHFFTLGLLGTIIGLVMATGGSMDGTKPVSEIVAGLKYGLNTAFFTTICGIVFSLLLQLQLLILKSGLKK